MRRVVVCTAALMTCGPLALMGQFRELATTDDGSTLYFAATVRPKGSSLSLHLKIYRWTAVSGVVLYAEEPSEGFDGCAQEFFYQLHSPQVSADGGVIGYTGTRPTTTGKFCSPVEPNEAVISMAGNRPVRLRGNVALSRNGRYAVTVPADAQANEYHLVTDLASGQTSVVNGAFDGSAWRVTDTGAVVTPRTTAIVLTERDGRTRVLPTQQAVEGAAIDRMGQTIVYTTRFGPSNPGRMAAIDVASGRETQLGTSLGFSVLGISQDGQTVYYEDGAHSSELYAIGTKGLNPRRVAQIDGPLGSAVVSGDGRVAYATSGSRLLRIDMVSGAVTEIIPVTPELTAAFRGGLPPQTTVAPAGSVMVLWGGGLRNVREASFCGSPVSLIETPVILMPSVRFQVPWDLADGACLAVVRTNSPFESALLLDVRQRDPQFIHDTTLYVLYHENFSGFISAFAPAQAGEVISFYMTGLGPVDGRGMVSADFSCRVDFSPADILYAGVAPGAAGFYQVNLRVPAKTTLPSASLMCGFPTDLEAFAPIWVR